jgi:hypothetical protein
MPAGKDATGRCSALRVRFPAVRGRPLPSTDGRGPSLTFGEYALVRSRSLKDGLVDWVDRRGSEYDNSSREFIREAGRSA